MNQDSTSKKPGYGGRPLWQWILIYLVVGGLIYAGIYYFMEHKSASGYGQPMKASAQGAAPVQRNMKAVDCSSSCCCLIENSGAPRVSFHVSS